jgi:hypothetical protein
VPEKLGRLVEQDDVYPPFGCEVGQGYRYGNLERAASDPFRGGQDRHVEIAIRPGRAARPRAEDGQGRNPWDRFHGTGQLLIDFSHVWIVASECGGGRLLLGATRERC